MKKFITIFAVLLSLLTASAGYSEEKKKEVNKSSDNNPPSWFMIGYGYSQSVGNSWSPQGPIKFTVGGNIWKFIGIELTADINWQNWNGWANNRTYKNLAWSLDLKPYVLISQSIGNQANAIMPYVGIAPVISLSGLDYRDNYLSDKASFDIGVAAKGGLRFKFFKLFMAGAGIEYVYHFNGLPAMRNMSHFNAIFEAGITW